MAPRDLDYAPLTGRLGLGARLRAMAGDNVKLVGVTVLALVTFGFGVAFVVAVITGGLFSGVGLFAGVFLLGCLLGWGTELGKAGHDGRLAAFARANRLELTSGESAEHYLGSLFADGSHIVRVSVRTQGESFVEIGERWPVTAPRTFGVSVTNQVSAQVRTPELFLRARLRAPLPTGVTADQLVSSELDADLTEFAGRCTVELSGREMTVLGSRELDPTKPERMREAFGLIGRLVDAAEAARIDGGSGRPAPSGVAERKPPEEPRGRKLRAPAVIGLTVALIIVVPVFLALVMSVIDDELRGHRGVATIVVGLIVMLAATVVAWFVRLVSRRRR